MRTMRLNSHQTSLFISGVLVLCALVLSGCAGAVVGVSTAAVAASTTEKGFSTSVSDGVIFTKLKDRFLQANSSLLTSAEVTVNEGAVLFTGKVKTPEDKIEATKLAWEIRGVREVVNPSPGVSGREPRGSPIPIKRWRAGQGGSARETRAAGLR